jgi:hypothetical protein
MMIAGTACRALPCCELNLKFDTQRNKLTVSAIVCSLAAAKAQTGLFQLQLLIAILQKHDENSSSRSHCFFTYLCLVRAGGGV